MERYLVLFVLLLLGAIIAESVRHSEVDGCPKFAVKRNSIIRTKDSKARGAKMISKENVDSARECFLLCCENEKCNVGILRYSHHEDDDESDRVSRKCYLFDCKEPNICVFVNHTNYAVIQLHRNDPKTPTEEHPLSKCPPNVPVAMCAEDPCKSATCSSHPNAECKANYCGGCNTEFFVDGSKVKCDYDVTTHAVVMQPTTAIKSDTADSSLENGESVSEEVEINPEDAGPLPTENYELEAATADPYAVKEWRKFLTHPDEKKLYETTEAPVTADVKKIVKEDASPSPILHVENVPKVKYLDRGTTSVPLLIALIACIIVLIAVIWRLRCSGRGKLNKKFAVDDGDYLINGMYL